VPVDRQAKLIFVHIPKTAGTSIEFALDLHGEWRRQNLDHLFGLIQSPELLRKKFSSNFLQHLRLHEIHSLLGDQFDEYDVFTVVRDPWTRFLSSFRRKDPDLCSYVRWRSLVEINDLSLNDYFEIACWARHPHLNSQASFFRPANTSTSTEDVLKRIKVFKYEELPLLEDYLSIKYGRKISFGRHQNPVASLPPISEDNLADLKRKVYKLYRRDYKLFGYKPPKSV